MPDKDEFEPMGRAWKTVYALFVDGERQASSQKIAQCALQVVSAMLHECGGCPPLPQLILLLSQLSESQAIDIPARCFPAEVLQQAHAELDQIEKSIADQRVCAVAVRTTRSYVHELVLGLGPSQVPGLNKIGPDLAQRIIKDVIAHSCLDRARAFAVNSRFENGAASLRFYREVMQAIEYFDDGLSLQFCQDPSCRTLSYSPPLLSESA